MLSKQRQQQNTNKQLPLVIFSLFFMPHLSIKFHEYSWVPLPTYLPTYLPTNLFTYLPT